MTAIGKGFLYLLAGMLALFLLINVASAQTMHRTHGCTDFEASKELADHIAAHVWVGYDAKFRSLGDRCHLIVSATPPQSAMIYQTHGNGVIVTLFMGTVPDLGRIYSIFVRGYLPKLNPS